MSTFAAYPHIVKEPGAPATLESHPRTRVAMIVMDYQARGLSPEEIVRHYPYLTQAEVHAAMTYYHDHRDEIDAEIQAELDELENGPDVNLRSAVWHALIFVSMCAAETHAHVAVPTRGRAHATLPFGGANGLHLPRWGTTRLTAGKLP